MTLMSNSLLYTVWQFFISVGSRTVRNKRQLKRNKGPLKIRGKTVNETSSIVWWPWMGPPQSHSQVASSHILAEKRKVRFLPVDKAAVHVCYTWVWASILPGSKPVGEPFPSVPSTSQEHRLTVLSLTSRS